MGFPAAWPAGQNQVGALIDPAVPGADRRNMRFGDHRHRVELKAVEGFSRRPPRVGEVAFNTAAVAFGDLMFGQRGEEARGGPAFLVRAFGEARPALFERGQPEIVEKLGQTGAIDALGHDMSPVSPPRIAWACSKPE